MARLAIGTTDKVGLVFDARRAFYLRLVPYYAREKLLSHADLADLAAQRQIDLPVRQLYSAFRARNRYGAIMFEAPGTAQEPRALTQVFPNGELWAATTEFFVHHRGDDLIPTTNVYNIFRRVLANFVSLFDHHFANGAPVVAILGAVGLEGYSLPMSRTNFEGYAGPIHQNELELRTRLDDPSEDNQERLVDQFVRELYDLAGVRLGDAVPWK